MSEIDAILRRAGLETIAAEELYPEIQRDNDRIWLTVVREGERVKLFEVSLRRAAVLIQQLAEAICVLGGR